MSRRPKPSRATPTSSTASTTHGVRRSRRRRRTPRTKRSPGSMQRGPARCRSKEHTYELQSLMRISYAVFCLKKKITKYKLFHYTKIPLITLHQHVYPPAFLVARSTLIENNP